MLDSPRHQRAVQQGKDGQITVANGVPVPSLPPGYVLVKTSAVALNPADNNILTNFPLAGAFSGIDFSGTIVQIGSGVDSDAVKLGDQVGAGAFTFSNEHRLISGAFSEYVRVKAHLLLRQPAASRLPSALPLSQPPPPCTANGGTANGGGDMSFAELATLSTAISTCILSFWKPGSLELQGTPARPLVLSEGEEPIPVLVYGGATAVGTIAIQLLKLSGYAPIATCSPVNFALVKSRGAVAAFDYAEGDVAAQIAAHAHDRLKHVIDCISTEPSVAICLAAIQRPGGRYVSLQHISDSLLAKRRAVVPMFALAAEAFGEEISLGSAVYDRPMSTETTALVTEHIQMLQREVLDQRKLQAHPVELLEGGLEGVIGGLQRLANQGVSARKLVAVLD